MGSNKLDLSKAVDLFSDAPTMAALPELVDVNVAAPQNPPEAIQSQFVGLSYKAAYSEASSFVTVADEWHTKHRRAPMSEARRVLDFGSGWGRITRMLLTQLDPTSIYALDVDSQMTALVNTTLPGVNAITVDPSPPVVLGDDSMDVGFAFSVFSHLAPAVHDQWAHEFGRIVAPGGIFFITVLDKAFLDTIAGAKKRVEAGTADDFSRGMADLFPDIRAVTRAFEVGEPAYAGNGGGGVRSGDFYGWAALPKSYVTRVWGEAGFDIVEWVNSGTLFQQAMVALVRRGGSVTAARRRLSASFGRRR